MASIPSAVRAALLLCASAILPSSAAEGLARGEEIARGTCVACHGFPPSGGPETVAGDATRIVGAFDKRPPMSSLRGVLSPSDISDVTEYLASLEPSAPATPAHDATDLWWNAEESGWGLSFTHHASHGAFGVLFVYGVDNAPAWYVLPGGRWTTPTTFVGRFYATRGPHFAVGNFDPAGVSVRQVGALRLTMLDRDRATLAFTIDNRLYVKTLTRQPF